MPRRARLSVPDSIIKQRTWVKIFDDEIAVPEFFVIEKGMCLMMKATDCAEAVYGLVACGEIEKALELCGTEPCSTIVCCQRYLGWTYYRERQLEKALNWFARAADQEDGEALFGMGSVYVVRKDYHSALQYFERAVDHGYARGNHWIGGIYQHGCGIPADINKATSYYQQGAAHGFIMAKRSLINIASQQGGVVTKIILLPKLINLYMELAKIAYFNIDDPRIADIRNVFEKYSKLVVGSQVSK